MSKQTTEENYRVVVEPRRWRWGALKHDFDRETCESILEQIRRHVDDVQDSYISFDIVETCEHCGAEWTEDDSDYNGGCCEEDQAAYESRIN
jgi:hypothetical protein